MPEKSSNRRPDERRNKRRDPCSVKVDFALHRADCSRVDCGPWINVTFDISYSGMGIYSERPFDVGQKLKIFLRHLSNDPIIAQVKWCNRLSENLFRIGLTYC